MNGVLKLSFKSMCIEVSPSTIGTTFLAKRHSSAPSVYHGCASSIANNVENHSDPRFKTSLM